MKRLITKTVQSTTFFLFIFSFLTIVKAQHNTSELPTSINATGAAPDASAMLDVQSTNKGILIPRLANTAAVANPVEGLMIYDNSTDIFKFYDGSVWKSFGGGGGLSHISFPATENTFVGVNVGVYNTTGAFNTAIGYSALRFNRTGVFNTANGIAALYSNTGGSANTANGGDALSSNTIGSFNTANGNNALSSNTTGDSNTANGNDALSSNRIGSFNTANGNEALLFNTTGDFNTANGNSALFFNTTGESNTANGSNTLFSNTTGTNNTAIGRYALISNATESYNTAIGSSAFTNVYNSNNSTAIGYEAQPTASNQVRLGNSSITEIGGYVGWSNVSDARFKTQIQSNVPGLAFISLLNPVTYQMDMDVIAKHQHTPDSLRLAESERAKAAIRYTGFLAQDVEKAAESINYDFSGVDAPQHERDNYSLRYAEFVVPLVKAVQELDEKNGKLIMENEKLAKANELLKAEKDAEVADLEARLGKIEALLQKQ